VQVGEVEQREETRTLDCHPQLALVARLGAGDARRMILPFSLMKSLRMAMSL
jgi:hypothetical protein